MATSSFVRSPDRPAGNQAVGPTRPLAVRHLSADLETYIDMYELGNQGDTPARHDSPQTEQDYLFSGDINQELQTLQNLRRLSLDVSNLDPDVPPQNYEVKPAIGPHNDDDEYDMGNSLYWVPARIHPELAPQEWQTFVQKRDGLLTGDDSGALLRKPSSNRGLSRSKSLLSREVSDRTAERYHDAGPELERRRSVLKSRITMSDLETLDDRSNIRRKAPSMNRKVSSTSIAEEGLINPAGDEPLVAPPPGGQILRRAARTGKARGSYRKFARPRTPEPSSLEPSELRGTTNLPDFQMSEAGDFHVRADISQSTLPDVHDSSRSDEQGLTIVRQKSNNRTVQIVGARIPSDASKLDQSEFVSELNLTSPIKTVSSDAHISTQKDKYKASADLILVEAPQTSSRSQDLSIKTLPRDSSLNHIPHRPNNDIVSQTPQEGTATDTKRRFTSTEPPVRPGLRREISAASLTRAVMNGTAPAPVSSQQKSPPRQPATEAGSDGAIPVQASAPNSKKSAWGKLFSSDDKDKNRARKEKDSRSATKARTMVQENRAPAEKESSSTNLFSTIFGGKKREKESIEVPRRDIAVLTPKNIVREPRFYARYPIQLERAIYRMAHLKLGNSRRPLAHQVLLSNFMYGYLALVGGNSSGQAQGPSAHNRARPSRGSTTNKPEEGGQGRIQNHTEMEAATHGIT